MKNTIIILLIGASLWGVQITSGQDLGNNVPNFNEMTRQNKTQKKYLIQQVALLETYGELLRKGYEICKYGLNNIGTIKDADFSQHKVYFNSLKNVKPSIANSLKVRQILAWEKTLNKEMKTFISYASRQSVFSKEEKDYFDQVATNVRTGSSDDLDHLDKLITSGKTSMEDDDRMKRIDTLHRSSASRFSFVRSFRDQSMTLAAQRSKEKQELDYSSRLQQDH